MLDLKTIWQKQRDFDLKFIPHNLSLIDQERETQKRILFIIDELMELVRNLSWKDHRKESDPVIYSNILEELVDIFKYWNGICLLWGFDESQFIEEWKRKTLVVEQRWKQEFQDKWDPKLYKYCAVIDIDGVLADYVSGFFRFIYDKTGVVIPESRDMDLYAHVGKFIGHEETYNLKHEFRLQGIESSGLDPIPGSIEFMKTLFKVGAYILLMTSRPYQRYRRMMADTILWLNKYEIPFHHLLFHENKEDQIIKEWSFAKFVIEDTLSNAQRISSKGIKVYLRNTCYNQSEINSDMIIRFNDFMEIL